VHRCGENCGEPGSGFSYASYTPAGQCCLCFRFPVPLPADTRRHLRCILREIALGCVLHVPQGHVWGSMAEQLLQTDDRHTCLRTVHSKRVPEVVNRDVRPRHSRGVASSVVELRLEGGEVEGGALEEGELVKTCNAFPSGIPQKIWNDQFDHRQPYRGDHGIRWEQERPDLPHPNDEASEPFSCEVQCA
jgi:hypothetical protein